MWWFGAPLLLRVHAASVSTFVVPGMSSRILFKNLRYRAVLFPEANKKAKTNRFLHSAFSGFQLFSFLTSVTGTREQL